MHRADKNAPYWLKCTTKIQSSIRSTVQCNALTLVQPTSTNVWVQIGNSHCVVQPSHCRLCSKMYSTAWCRQCTTRYTCSMQCKARGRVQLRSTQYSLMQTVQYNLQCSAMYTAEWSTAVYGAAGRRLYSAKHSAHTVQWKAQCRVQQEQFSALFGCHIWPVRPPLGGAH